MLGRPLGGAAMNLAAAVGALDEHAATNGLAALLTGSRQDRRDAAKLIVRLGRPEHTAALIPLISDPHADVRAEAAQALAIRVASPEGDTDTLAVSGLRRALADPGALMPLAIASGIATVRATDQAGELVRPLLRHPSARVREAAQAVSQ
jgi:HEAT repeat protein